MPTHKARHAATDAHATAAALRVLIGQLRRRLREQAKPGDFSNSQLSVLGRLMRDGAATVTTLARAERMRPQSMGALVAGLEGAGFVKRAPDPADGRQALLAVTAKCRTWIKARRAAREDWLCRSIRAKLDVAEQQQLASAVELLQRILEP